MHAHGRSVAIPFPWVTAGAMAARLEKADAGPDSEDLVREGT